MGSIVAAGGLLVGLGFSAGPASAVTKGGTITVLHQSDAGGTWTTLDPVQPIGFEFDYENAIYGELVEQNAKGKIIPDIAKSWSLTDEDKTLTLHIRPGVMFTDGTQLNAKAVAFNWNRDFDPKNACQCLANFSVSSVSTQGSLTVVMHLKQSDPAIVQALPGSAPNWIISPTSFQKEGAQKFGIAPVGAGPFKVQSNNLSNTLALVRNPNYWEKGHPYLNEIKFSAIGSDQSALQALYAGDAQAYVAFTAGSISLLPQVRAHGIKVYTSPGTLTDDLQMNTLSPPFNNIKAREAVYYATNTPAIIQHLFGGVFPLEEGICAEGCDFYQKLVPGYRTYNPAKAKALVKQLGGLRFDITTYQSLGLEQTAEALQAEFEAVGMHVTIHSLAAATVVTNYKNHTWQAFMTGEGSTDPALGGGPAAQFTTTGPDSGVKDPVLTKMIEQASAQLNAEKRRAEYDAISKYISDHAYATFLFTQPGHSLSTASIHGMTDTVEVPWENVSVSGQ